MENEIHISWWERQKMNKMQLVAIFGGLLHSFSAGIHIVLEIHYIGYGLSSQYIVKEKNPFFHIGISWFVGVILGSLISSFLVKSVQKRTIYYLVAIFSSISNLLMITLCTSSVAILAARYIAGFAHGILLIPILIHAAEIVTNEIRGQQLSSISVGISLGICIQAIIFAETGKDLHNAIWLAGIISLISAVLSVIFTYLFTYESPIYLISKGCDLPALTSMIKLRNESLETWEIRKDYFELQEILNEDQKQSSNIFSEKNMFPLFRITLLRSIFVFSTSAPIYIILTAMTERQFFKISPSLFSYSASILFACRVFTEIFALCTIDRIGRRLLMFLSAETTGWILIIMGAIFIQTGFDNAALCALSILYFIAAGVGIGPASFTYLGEAFPLKKKPLSMFFVIFVENLLNIILTYTFMYGQTESTVGPIMFAIGGISIVHGFYLYIILPETKQLELKECINKMI